MKKNNDFMQEYNNSWDHHPILAMAESSLDVKLSKGRLALSCGLLKRLLWQEPADSGESQRAARKGSPGTNPDDDSQAEKKPGSLVQKQGVTLGTTGIFGSQQLLGPLGALL